jgi:hypothetical protein
MSTTISLFAEHKDGNNWVSLTPVEKNPYYDPDDFDDAILEPLYKPLEIDVGQNYSLFAILANARNGNKTEGDFEYIAPPRGLPEDVSDIIRAWYDSWEGYAHNASWLYFEEILNFDWKDKVIQRCAMVDPRVAHLFRDNPLGFPSKNWPTGVQMSYATYMKEGVEVRWKQTYAEAAQFEFLTNNLLKFQRKEYAPKTLRAVFWFDS